MKRKSLLSCLILLVLSANCYANNTIAVKQKKAPETQELKLIESTVKTFLQGQTEGAAGKVSITVYPVDKNLILKRCDEFGAAFVSGNKAWGKTSVAVTCGYYDPKVGSTDKPWTINVQAHVKVDGQYIVAAAPISQGREIEESDLMIAGGDLTKLPAGIFYEKQQLIGVYLKNSVMTGTTIRQEMIKVMPIVTQGQQVTIVSNGNGFKVSSQGKALTSGNKGGVVQVKTNSGVVLSGLARENGVVEINSSN